MPALITATVLRWDVDWDCEPPNVYFVDSESVTIYVADGEEAGEVSAIVGQYIIEHEGDEKELLQAARDGLLQVIEIYRAKVTAPAVPPHTHKPKKKKGTPKATEPKTETAAAHSRSIKKRGR
jgi:hypothetical protein